MVIEHLKVKDLFKFTGKEEDKLRIMDIKVVLKKYYPEISFNSIKKNLTDWGAVHCGETKLRIKGSKKTGVGYYGIKFANKKDNDLLCM